MCGIIGCISVNSCSHIIVNGLEQLKNRGYDSAGMSTLAHDVIQTTKYASSDTHNSIALLKEDSKNHIGHLGIGHTRWATHGAVNKRNAHPHTDTLNNFSIVHNGIIENHQELRDWLCDQNPMHIFKSETDSEVIVHLISVFYETEKNIEIAIRKTVSKLEGTYAIVILSTFDKKLYCVRKGSPLLFAGNKSCTMVTSEVSGFCNQFETYMELETDQVYCIELGKDIDLVARDFKQSSVALTPHPFKFWTKREIHEQPESIARAINLGGRIKNSNSVHLGGFLGFEDRFVGVKNIVLLGCGTSFNAGLIGEKFFKEINRNLNTVQVFDGSEFTKQDMPSIGKTIYIFISQSGETRDLIDALEICEEEKVFTIGVINSVDSLIARRMDCGVYTNCGREVAVASTKSFTSQCVVLSLIAIFIAQLNQANEDIRSRFITDLLALAGNVSTVFKDYDGTVANMFYDSQSMYILGKGINSAVAKEGALKIKEMSYVHAEGYMAKSLKHGPFGLLNDGFPVILLETEKDVLDNVYQEVCARRASVLRITPRENKYGKMIKIPKNDSYGCILSSIVLQLLAFDIAIYKKLNPDFPKNLAKCVTTG